MHRQEKCVSNGAIKIGSFLRQFLHLAPAESQIPGEGGLKPDVVPEGFTPITQFLRDDIFIVGYPRSGNTWFQNLVSGVIYGVDPRVGPAVLAHELVPDLGFGKYYRRYATPMYFKSHALPCSEYRRVVYLLRDGRDVMVSYHHFLEATLGKEVDFLQCVSSEAALYPCHWAQHVDAWMQNPHQAQMLVIKYEDLLREPVTELRRFCNFVGVSREPGHMATIAEAAAFRNLREREECIGFGRSDVSFPPGKYFFRRGVTGSHKDEMPPAVLERFLEQASRTLCQCGYSTGEHGVDNCQLNDEGCEYLRSQGQ
jgi:Sulfotransferase domain